MPIKEIKLNRFDTIAEDTRDLPNGQFHYLENVNTGDFGHSAKQIPNVYTKDNDQCILKLVKYGSTIYGLGYENSTTKDVTLYQYDQTNNVYNALTNGTVAGGTIRLYAPFFGIMTDGVEPYIYFDPGTNYIARYKISNNTMSATWKAHNGGMLGGVNWVGNLYGWSYTDNNVYRIADGTSKDKDGNVISASVTSMIVVPLDQEIVELVPHGNYLEVIGTPATGAVNQYIKSADNVAKMYTWDGVTTTSFTEIVEIGYGIVSGADILDGLVYAVIGFANRKGFRIKAYSGGIFQTVYTYSGRKNEVSNYLYCQPASSVKAYTGYLYFIVVGARPGSSYASVYETVLFRYGNTNAGQTKKLSAYKSLDVTPGVGNTLGTIGNDFLVSEEVSPATLTDNVIYAVVYEAPYKTRQVYVQDTSVYAEQPGVVETAYFTGGDSHIKKQLMGVSVMGSPLPAGASIVVKYKADAQTSWTTIITADTDDDISLETLNETDGTPLPTFKEIAFRAELLGGAELTGLLVKYLEEGNSL